MLLLFAVAPAGTVILLIKYAAFVLIVSAASPSVTRKVHISSGGTLDISPNEPLNNSASVFDTH